MRNLRFVVSAYHHRAEQSYVFGPMFEHQVQAFIERMNASGEWDEPYVQLVNKPSLMGTGQELT